MAPSKRDFYTILGVFRDATQDEIKRAYLEAAQRLHPDRNVAAGETEMFLEAQQAYEVLSSPKRRDLYDATLPPEIKENLPVVYDFLYSRPNLVKITEPQLLYVLFEVGSREKSGEIQAPPLNICLVLDRSTSMQGEKIDMVKSAAVTLIRGLRPQDVFSVVAFSDRAEVMIPAAINWAQNKQENRVYQIQPSGATEIFQGLDAGLAEVKRSLDPARVNHIIILTDGHTYGDEQACFQLAEEAARLNIGITALGVGHEWNDIFLDALASRTGGSSAYISQPKDIEKILVNKFHALSTMFADDVLMEWRGQAGVRLNYAFRLQPEGGGIALDSTMHLGPISREAPLKVLFEFVVDPSAVEDVEELILLEGAVKVSITANPAPVSPIRVKLSRNIEAKAPSESAPPTAILGALSRLTLYRMQERARVAAEAGEYSSASRHLQNLATHLLSRGESALAKTALMEAESLERMHAFSDSGNKELKYRTRALLLDDGVKEKRK
ncbi:MAG: DnaJ domain-containing protein [Anaerolineales bacterium]|nr:DnaJ domain-containing protein [Anaerolineales bacterium]